MNSHLVAFVIVPFFLSGCALANPPSTKFTVHVIDAETMRSITNAVIQTGFTQKSDPWGTGGGKSTRVKKNVDENGLASFVGNTISEERGGGAFLPMDIIIIDLV